MSTMDGVPLDELGRAQQQHRARPDAHSQRYDRQLRLWASSGQQALERAHILLIGAGAFGTSTLKNLVLPGIGAFSILDAKIVDATDLGNNFFLEEASLGKSRAQETVRLLAELNPSVKGHAVVQDPLTLASTDPSFFSQFSLILCVNQPDATQIPLAQICWDNDIPIVLAHSSGMAAQFNTQVRECAVVETHPPSLVDLRLTSPFAALTEFALSGASDLDVGTSDTMIRSHIPFVIILLKKLEEWKEKHGGTLPSTSDRAAFVASINAARQPGNPDEENIDEALAALGQHIWRPLGAGKVPSEIEALFNDPSCENVSAKSSNFWLLVRAVRSFVRASSSASPPGGDGHLPLSGALPDMKATSTTYVALQRTYRAKARADLEAVQAHLTNVLLEAGLDGQAIPQEEIESFVKHAGYLRCIRGRSVQESREKPSVDTIIMAFMDPVNPITITTHLAFSASEAFYAKHGRYPGASTSFTRSVIGLSNSSQASASGSISAPSLAPAEPAQVDLERESKRAKSDAEMKDAVEVDAEPDIDIEEDLAELERVARPLLVASGVLTKPEAAEEEWEEEEVERLELVRDAFREIIRSAHSDLPSTAALMGGILAQESIKLVTRQYVPVDNTCVYDGIKAAVGAFRL